MYILSEKSKKKNVVSTTKNILPSNSVDGPNHIVQKKMQHFADNSHEVNKVSQIQGFAIGNNKAEDHIHQDRNYNRAKKTNNTGMPDKLKSGIEALSGYSMDDVEVHFKSDEPAKLGAFAFAQGSSIHLAPGQEKHLPHEAWHVVQQKQGRVRATHQMKGNINVNNDNSLEREADVMGSKANQFDSNGEAVLKSNGSSEVKMAIVQGVFYPVGPKDQNDMDDRNEINVEHMVDNVYLDPKTNEQYTLEKDIDNSYYLLKLKSLPQSKTVSSSVKKMVKGKRKKGERRPVYKNAARIARLSREGDIDAREEAEEFVRSATKLDPNFRANKKKLGSYGKIRDKAVKRNKSDERGTGNDETQQTTLFPLAFSQDAGVSKDPLKRTVDVGEGGQQLTRMDTHEYTRTNTRSIPLIGGDQSAHPGVAVKERGKKGFYQNGNSDLDRERSEAFLGYNGPASQWSAMTDKQVKMTKKPIDVVQDGSQLGFDPEGRDLATDSDAQQDLAFESGRTREVFKRMRPAIELEYPNATPLREAPPSPRDMQFDVDDEEIAEAVRNPQVLERSSLLGTLKNPVKRPSDWSYDPALRDLELALNNTEFEIDSELCKKAYEDNVSEGLEKQIEEYKKMVLAKLNG